MTDWDRLIRNVLWLPPHQSLEVKKLHIPHPLKVGFIRSIGLPKGQKADYRKPLANGNGIHVREYEKHYEVHRDRRDPSADPLGHLILDAPYWIILILAVVFGVMIRLRV